MGKIVKIVRPTSFRNKSRKQLIKDLKATSWFVYPEKANLKVEIASLLQVKFFYLLAKYCRIKALTLELSRINSEKMKLLRGGFDYLVPSLESIKIIRNLKYATLTASEEMFQSFPVLLEDIKQLKHIKNIELCIIQKTIKRTMGEYLDQETLQNLFCIPTLTNIILRGVTLTANAAELRFVADQIVFAPGFEKLVLDRVNFNCGDMDNEAQAIAEHNCRMMAFIQTLSKNNETFQIEMRDQFCEGEHYYSAMNHLLRQNKNIDCYLNMEAAKVDFTQVAESLTKNNSMRKLSILYKEASQAKVKSCLQAIQSHLRLQHMEIEGQGEWNKMSREISMAFNRCPRLIKYSMLGINKIPEGKCKTALLEISIESSNLRQSDVYHICNLLQLCLRLRTFKLQSNTFTTGSNTKALFEVLSLSQTIKEVSIVSNGGLVVDPKTLAKCIADNKAIRTMTIKTKMDAQKDLNGLLMALIPEGYAGLLPKGMTFNLEGNGHLLNMVFERGKLVGSGGGGKINGELINGGDVAHGEGMDTENGESGDKEKATVGLVLRELGIEFNYFKKGEDLAWLFHAFRSVESIQVFRTVIEQEQATYNLMQFLTKAPHIKKISIFQPLDLNRAISLIESANTNPAIREVHFVCSMKIGAFHLFIKAISEARYLTKVTAQFERFLSPSLLSVSSFKTILEGIRKYRIQRHDIQVRITGLWCESAEEEALIATFAPFVINISH